MFALTIFGVVLNAVWYTVILFVWLILAFLPANIAKSKGQNFWVFFLLSLFFWWITFFVAIFMRDNTKTPSAPVAS